MSETETVTVEALPSGSASVAVLLAVLIPGLGHVYLGRRGRGVLFSVLIFTAIAIGYSLQGNLWTPVAGRPLTVLATLGTMGMGLPYVILNSILKYQGSIASVGFDYGTTFLTSAGLMNLLLILDAFDIVSGRKS